MGARDCEARVWAMFNRINSNMGQYLDYAMGKIEKRKFGYRMKQQTGFVLVAQSRSWLPDWIGGVYWFGVDDTYTTVFLPMCCGITKVPESYAEGNLGYITALAVILLKKVSFCKNLLP